MAYQILVVESQRETSKAICAGIQSLGSEFSVATTLSGEEALLEARLRKFDLLISEVRLTGMSGVELIRKLKISKPDMKAILISSSIDRYVRREAADMGIENIIQKPLEISSLLDDVQKILGLHTAGPEVINDEEVLESETIGVSDRLASLRQELQASFTLLMSDTGEILMQVGDLQLGLESEKSSLTSVFSAGHQVSRLLGKPVSDNFYAFKGNKIDLIMTHVGDSHALLIAIPSTESGLVQMDKIYGEIQRGTRDLHMILTDMGVASATPSEAFSDEALVVAPEDIDEQVKDFEIDQGLDALFSSAEKEPLPTDVDNFWEITTVEDTGIFANADALSYEQARQLGLAPSEET